MGRKGRGSLARNEKLGVCVRSPDETVQYQNETCKGVCGDQIGKKCDKGCTQHYSRTATEDVIQHGVKLIKNVMTDGNVVDAFVYADEDTLVTILHAKTRTIKGQLAELKRYSLSKAETGIIEKVLMGFSNEEIRDSLFISRPTLKTHLNNIYKKLPDNLKQHLLALRIGPQPKAKKNG